MRLFAILPAVLLCAATVSCDDEPGPNDPSQYDPNAGYQGGQYPPQPGYPQPGYPQPGYPQPGQPPAPAATAPQPAPQPGAAAAGTCAVIPPAAAAIASPMLAQLAATETRGMNADGAVIAANCQPGQTIEHAFQIQPNRCYAVVGVGVGVTELDIQIVAHQPPAPPWVIAQDQGTGPQAVVGGQSNCVKNPLPVGGPAKVVVKSTGGGGIVMAQIFSK